MATGCPALLSRTPAIRSAPVAPELSANHATSPQGARSLARNRWRHIRSRSPDRAARGRASTGCRIVLASTVGITHGRPAGTEEGICSQIHDTGTERCREPHCARQSAFFGGPVSPPVPGGYCEGPRAHSIGRKVIDALGRLELCKGIAPQDRCLDVTAAGCCRDIGSGQTGTTGRPNPGACRRVSGLGWQVSGSGPPFGRVRHNCS